MPAAFRARTGAIPLEDGEEHRIAAELRPATAGDAAALTAVFLAARRAAMPYLPELHTDAEIHDWMAGVVLPGSHVVVATAVGGLPAGFAAVRADHLDHLYVAPMAQGQGIGARLLAAAKAVSPQGLRLHVFQRNLRARVFYERRGFRTVTLRDGAENEEREPDAIYVWLP